MIRTRILMAVIAGALLSLPLASTAAVSDEEKKEIAGFLNGTLGDGYREKNIEKFLSAYAADADIVHYIIGRTSREKLGKHTAGDFAKIGKTDVQLEILGAGSADEGLKALMLFRTFAAPGESPFNRSDRYWLLLRRGDEGWRIHRQSYREDFGVTEMPHVGR